MALARNLFSIRSFSECYIYPNSWLTLSTSGRGLISFFFLQRAVRKTGPIHQAFMLKSSCCCTSVKKREQWGPQGQLQQKMVTTRGRQQARCIEPQQSKRNRRRTGHLTATPPQCTAVRFADTAWSAFLSHMCTPGFRWEFWLFTYCPTTEFPGQSRLQKKHHAVYC